MLLAVGRQESFLGPLPHPAHFAAYDETEIRRGYRL